jgi:hypothetical protein
LEAIMAGHSNNGGPDAHVRCPVCEGLGHGKRSELASRLEASRERLTKPAEQPEPAGVSQTFEQEVLTGPIRRILWRRSPKE